jgi:hypothetical protein
MDLLLLLLIVLLVLSLAGWGYGTYYYRPAAPAGDVVAEPAPVGWASPLGILAVLAVVAIVVMFVTGWRPMPMW